MARTKGPTTGSERIFSKFLREGGFKADAIVRAPYHNFSSFSYSVGLVWFGYNMVPNNLVSTQLKFPLKILIPRGDIGHFWLLKLWQLVLTLAILRSVA